MAIEKNTPNFLKHSGLMFTTVLNETMNMIPDDGSLGIYCYLASKPNDWVIREKDLQTRFSKGRDYIRNKISILKQVGLIKVDSVRDDNGKIISWKTTLLNYLNHITENLYSCSNHQITENPESGFPRHLENPTHTNKRNKQIKEKEKIKYLSSSGDEPSLFESFWKAYPRKQNKVRAEKIWNKKKLGEMHPLIIQDVLDRLKNDHQWKEKMFIPLADTYLNNERWNDEVIKRPTVKPVLRTVSNESRSTVKEWAPGNPDYDRIMGK